MSLKSIPVVHPRVIELSRGLTGFAISLGTGCGPSTPASGCGPVPGSREGSCRPDAIFLGPESGLGSGAGSFGVKRPLRFLAYKLGLNEQQVGALAAILDELKTERAQAMVDDRRTLSAFAEAVSGETFDESKATEGAALREKSADRLGDAVVKALGRIHGLLTPEQRERFAYLIRTGTVLL